MKLSQLIESFVISNDQFEDYLNRATEQLAQELSAGKNARDAIHDLSVEFSNQHNKAYDAYVRMSDSLTARMHTLELDSPADMMNEPMADMGIDNEPEMMTDPMGDMEMDTPADSEMPSDSDMDDYAAVMDNEPEVEESVNESEERPYICVHAKKGKHECHAKTSYEAAKKAAKAWGLKSTAGIDAHLAVEEGVKDVVKGAGKKIKKAGKKVAKFFGHDETHPAFGEFEDGEFDESAQWCGICGNDTCTCPPDAVSESMEVINQIVADKQAGKLHGMTVDMFTASAIKQIYDAVNETNKAKFDELMTSKEGVLKAANIAMKMMKEGINEEKLDEFLPALGAVAGAAARAVLPTIARALPTVARVSAVGKDVVGSVKDKMSASKDKYKYEPQSVASKMMTDATRIEFSEYNEFYKALDAAAKAGKKAGDSIEVGGKTIKLKSNPKQMHQLSDSDMDKIDALAQRLNEKGCGSHKYKK